MPLPSTPDPLSRLLAVHAETRQRLQSLTGAPSAAGAFIAWFEGPARLADDILEHRLFPALIESMAGSDAVCLKGMTGGLARDRADLDRRWRQTVRPALDRPTAEATRTAVQAWAPDLQVWLTRTDEELLPMAARLLDDTALDTLAADCSALDAPAAPC